MKKNKQSLLLICNPETDLAKSVIDLVNYLDLELIVVVSSSRIEPLDFTIIEGLSVDFIISLQCYQKIPKNIISRSSVAINIHPGPPYLRGSGAASRALLGLEKTYAVTTHLINDAFDSGKILWVDKFSLTTSDDLLSLERKISTFVFERARRIIELIVNQEIYTQINNLEKSLPSLSWSGDLGKISAINELRNVHLNISAEQLSLKIRALHKIEFPLKLTLHGYDFFLSNEVKSIHQSLAIVIPTYNRLDQTILCIQSVVREIVSESRFDIEIVVVDDCSTLEIKNSLKQFINDLNDQNNFQVPIKFLEQNINRGVVEARLYGAISTCSDWILFLDSDNELLFGGLSVVTSSIESEVNNVILYRCCAESGDRIGSMNYPREATLNFMLNKKPDELACVMRREYFLKFFKSFDVRSLRRFESIAIYRMLMTQPFTLINEPIRLYKESGEDRLCSRENLKRDSELLFKGNLILLIEFGRFMTIKKYSSTVLRLIKYGLYSTLKYVSRVLPFLSKV